MATPTARAASSPPPPRSELATPVDWLIVGLGNPGSEYAGSPHNIGFEVANALSARWGLPKAKAKYRGLLTEGRTGPGGPRVAVLLPADLHERRRHLGRSRARGPARRP